MSNDDSSYLQHYMTMVLSDTYTTPFVEDESGNITGYGHQDKAAFAAAINAYERECGNIVDSDDYWLPSDIAHAWAILIPATPGQSDSDEIFVTNAITRSTPGAFPITTLWGMR